jgi:hypothetical protein
MRFFDLGASKKLCGAAMSKLRTEKGLEDNGIADSRHARHGRL